MRSFLRSFAGGEVSPEMFGRLDDIRFLTGLARARNFITLPHGPARNRPGFSFVRACPDSTQRTRLIPFIFSTTQSLVIELGTRLRHEVTVTSVSATGLTVSGTPFVSNGLRGDYVELNGAIAYITSNTTNTLSFSTWNTDTPSTGTAKVYLGYFRFHTDGSTVVVGSTPATYVPSQNIASVNAGADELTFSTAHGLTTADPVNFTVSGGTITTNIVAGTVYYAIVVSPTVIRLATTEANALAGTPLFDIGVAGTGTTKMHRYYVKGDLVTLGGTDVHYCRLDNPQDNAPPGFTNYWYALPVGASPAASIYELPHHWADVHLFDVQFDQSNDILTLTHGSYLPMELRRYASTRWLWTAIEFNAEIEPPTNVIGTPTLGAVIYVDRFQAATGGFDYFRTASNPHGLGIGQTVDVAGLSTAPAQVPDGPYVIGDDTGPGAQTNEFALVDKITGVKIALGTGSAGPVAGTVRVRAWTSDGDNTYKVTSVTADGLESAPSAATSAVVNNLFVEGAYNTISWTAAAGANRYRVYKSQTGLYGFIGQTEAVTFQDLNIAPDLGITPPELDDSLGGGINPAVCGHHEQRRLFAATEDAPQGVWATRSGTEGDLSYSLPEKADDRLKFEIAARQNSTVRHLIGLDDLIVLTSSQEMRVSSPSESALAPDAISVRPQSYVGSSTVRPVVADDSIVFFAARGGHVYSFAFDPTAQRLKPVDLSLRASHLFDGLTIVDSAHSKAPYPIIWCVSSDGSLLGLTYVPGQEVSGWHQHVTVNGAFESACVVPEGEEDRLYVVVQRTVNGSSVRYVERMAPMQFDDLDDAVFVDSSVTFTSVVAGTLSMSHLIGAEVSILADGIVLPNQTVSAGGTITMSAAYAKVTVGLPLDAQLQTLPMLLQVDGYGQGRPKSVSNAWVRVADSAPFQVGLSTSELAPSDAYAPSVRGLIVAETLSTTEVKVRVPNRWTGDGQVFVRQLKPLPLTVVGLLLEVSLGG